MDCEAELEIVRKNAQWFAQREHERGDCYRARALALMQILRNMREVRDYLTDIYEQAEDDFSNAQGELAAAREHAAISIARAASAELLAAAAETANAERDSALKDYNDLLDDYNGAAAWLGVLESGDDLTGAAKAENDRLCDALEQAYAARAEADGLAGLLAKALPELLNHGGDWDLRLRIRNALAARAQPPAKTAGTGA